MSEVRPTTLRITRSARLPDPLRIARYERAPELGPNILFFSGGSALRRVSRKLKRFTHNSTHLITPFDSGGSSATLRQAFGMLSVGDLRNRMIALADESVQGNPAVYELFSYRFDAAAAQAELLARLQRMVAGDDPLVSRVPAPLGEIIQNYLGFFLDAMPADFDLRGASIGNLILAGGYLNHGQRIEPVLFLFSKLVEVRGTVRAVVTDDLHLVAALASGETVIGQHRITGKEVPPLRSRIADIFLSRRLDRVERASAAIDAQTRGLIRDAELICYPIGSFFTSVMATLEPEGVGAAIAANGCPKVYVPNLGDDPEQYGMSVRDQVDALLRRLRRDAGELPARRFLDCVLVDSGRGRYSGVEDLAAIEDLGIDVVDLELVTQRSAPLIDEERLVAALLSLV
ncbi:MAG: GAK system CofD-like protein [Myxococcales bacterium]|nr:GAK system CofD-like protein [Myxococcales bacterium]